MRKLFFLTTAIVSVFLTITTTAFGFGVTPATYYVDLEPGDTLTYDMTVLNSDSDVIYANLKRADALVAKEGLGWDFFIEGESEPTAFSLRDWISFPDDHKTFAIDGNSSGTFPVTITVPQDAQPGAHMGALTIRSSQEASETTGNGFSFGFGLQALIVINVGGEIHEEIGIGDFTVNEEKLKKGDVEFGIQLENKGNTAIVPIGNIKIFNSITNEQVMPVSNVYEQTNGINTLIGTMDFIPFNKTASSVMPGSTSTLLIPWDHRLSDQGKYKAKLFFNYGQEDQGEHNAEVEFEISENLTIQDFTTNKNFYFDLPVSFSGVINNSGTTPLTPRGELSITNMLGVEKMNIEIDPEKLLIDGGKSLALPNDLTWDSGFAMGYYNATLKLTYGDSGQTIESSLGIWVISWWQILLTLAVLVALVTISVKLILSYKKMRKKVATLEKESKS